MQQIYCGYFYIVSSLPEYGVIIPTWNNLPFLQKCVYSIRKHSSGKHQIVVHVNEGADGTVDWLRKENIAFTRSGENAGICKAFNTAFRIAEKKFVMYMNDDMYALPGWDEELFRIVPSHDDWMVSATMIEPRASGNPCVNVADYGSDLSSFREHDLLREYKNMFLNDWSGSSWPPVMMPRHLWEKIGGFSEEFSPGMYSDPDLAMKVWQQGIRYFRGAGRSLVYHFQARTTQRIVRNNGRLTFMKKWGITPAFFYREYLKMGQPWNGTLLQPVHPGKLKLNRARVKIQTLFS